jgi:uncharacterized protein YneF (UPF0154 family)
MIDASAIVFLIFVLFAFLFGVIFGAWIGESRQDKGARE